MQTVTKKYKAEQKVILKSMIKDFNTRFKALKKANRKLCREVADLERYKTLSLEWYQVVRFESALELKISVYGGADKYNELNEKVIKPLLEEALEIEKIDKAIESMKTFSMSEKDSCYKICEEILDTWVPTEVVDGKLSVNGNLVGESAYVGVIIGKGKRIHRMKARVCIDEDTGEKFVGVFNNTQWWGSPVIVIDLAENMPKEAWSMV